MLTPLTSFPRCTLLFHGLGRGEEWGGDGQGGASSLRGDNGGGQGGRGLSWLGGWRVPGAPSLWLPFAPHIQVDPGLGSMQAACPASLLRIGWKEP